ncbi:NuA4 histone acetyltransferase complex Epl1 [Schizosaccharomyces japonicus yFS275]|uniref:Enhancer of polycomb-like protein n=1 Tax=Schizosaccharomyces japonicus (strain yFS275 / FY16936) TaxID=402676 RepID=B6K526_SCHJY|nr:NuA4 histone acetyltransferase complex Epl1 [Schizosaccharomyces japonicus yFS275]EEB08630.2 NuA4 histone acetyltransferase complex Epl1 [Schizosaccharomyces japonicus yFS275]
MSAVSKNGRAYRQRKVGIKTVMPIYRENEIPDFDEETSMQRTVPQVESGVEKEEEEERHLQLVIHAAHEAIVQGAEKTAIIPTRPAVPVGMLPKFYKKDYSVPTTWLRFSMTVEECAAPMYCMDERDVSQWIELRKQHQELERFSDDDYELCMQTFEDAISEKQPYLSIDKAQILSRDEILPFFDEKGVSSLKPLATELYGYWRSRKLERSGLSVMPSIQIGDDKDKDDPYICFRRREVRQPRKTRRSDLQSLERLRKLRIDMETSLFLLDQVLQRENKKLELLQTDRSVFQHRCIMKRLKRTLSIKDSDVGLFSPKRRPPVIDQKPSKTHLAPSVSHAEGEFASEGSVEAGVAQKQYRASTATGAAAAYRPIPTQIHDAHPVRYLEDVQADAYTHFQIRLQQEIAKRAQSSLKWVDLLENPGTALPFALPETFYRNVEFFPTNGKTGLSQLTASPSDSAPSPSSEDTASEDGQQLYLSGRRRDSTTSASEVLYRYSTHCTPRNAVTVRRRMGRGGRIILDRTYALPMHQPRSTTSRLKDRWLFHTPFDADDTIILDDESDASVLYRSQLLRLHADTAAITENAVK